MFATQQMLLHLLSTATSWYIDGTFKVLNHPFVHLLSIHAFAYRDNAVKQVQLLFVLTSARRKQDYRAVLCHLLSQLPSTPAVTTVTADF